MWSLGGWSEAKKLGMLLSGLAKGGFEAKPEEAIRPFKRSVV
jgi:hypothetical protein